ncbi:hypothetical protein MMC24_004221 [Lignoscripta atroalba]|nr:hypothetical protein [Lignoscripta atroalba]
MKSMLYVVVLLALGVPSCTAFLSSTFPRLKFASWYPIYGHHFKASSLRCNATLQKYYNGDEFGVAHHADCILENTTETIKANMASAGVILGLMPGVLANIGPTLAESSILMLERPFLSTLLAIGAPSIYPSRPFDNWDPLEVMKQPPKRFPNISARRPSYLAVSLLQYIIAMSASVNVVAVSLELGMKTVLLWKKSNSYFPLTWVVLSIVLHIGATLRLHLFIAAVSSSHRHRPPVTNHNGLNRSRVVQPKRKSGHFFYRLFRKVIDAEFRPCGTRTKLRLPSMSETDTVEEFFFSYLLALCLPLLSLIHVVVGVTIFSSLIFIGVNDTVVIVMRYGISALAVQLIRCFEATGLHDAYKQAREFEKSKQGFVVRFG